MAATTAIALAPAPPLLRPAPSAAARTAAPPRTAGECAGRPAAGAVWVAVAAFPLVAAATTRRRRTRRLAGRLARAALVEAQVPAKEAQVLAKPSGEGGGAAWLQLRRKVGSFLKGAPLLRLLPWRKPKLLPVTVLSGFLGSGKTTLLKHILRSAGEGGQAGKDGRPLRVAVIVNDMGEVNLDASEIKNSRLIKEEATMVELQNGCICCTLRGDLLKSVRALSEEKAFDYLVIESTGISEPLPVAQTFTMDVDEMMVVGDDEEAGEASGAATDAEGVSQEGAEAEAIIGAPDDAIDGEVMSLSHFARLDTMVTVVDALNIYEVLGSLETLARDNITNMLGNNQNEDELDERSIAQLMLDQIEFANVILLSKIDLVKGQGTVEEIRALLQKLNPSAKIIVPQPRFADLPLSEVINTHLFDMEEAEASAGWQQELAKHAEGGEGHTPETEEYGISSVVFRTDERPFHPGRFEAVLSSLAKSDASAGVFSGVVRAKGHLWMANAHSCPVELHVAGRHIQLAVNETFNAIVSPCCLTDDEHEYRQHLQKAGAWHPVYGDRDSMVVFIGVSLDKEGILAQLHTALLTDEEMNAGVASWRALVEGDQFFGTEYFEIDGVFEQKSVIVTE